jgi:hypothetical protein
MRSEGNDMRAKAIIEARLAEAKTAYDEKRKLLALARTGTSAADSEARRTIINQMGDLATEMDILEWVLSVEE